MAATKKSPRSVSARPHTAAARDAGIGISITNQRGQRYRYRAQAVSLSMRKGTLQVGENDGRCFLWFDHCELEVRRDARSNLVFHLKAGAASARTKADFVVLAEFLPAGKKTSAARRRFSVPLPAQTAAS